LWRYSNGGKIAKIIPISRRSKLKIQLIRQNKGTYEIIRNFNHSEDIIIQRTRVKILDEHKRVDEVFLLEGLGQLSWIPVETTGNHEVFAQIFVGEKLSNYDKIKFCEKHNIQYVEECLLCRGPSYNMDMSAEFSEGDDTTRRKE